MGYYTLGMPRINPDLKVHSFEPQPVTYKSLVRNLALNSLSGTVTTHNCGLGAENSVLTMFIPKFTGSGGASFANLHVEEGEPEVFETPVYSLDKYLDSKSAPDLIKVDVEGFEFEVMLGSQAIITKDKPTIVIELLRKWMKPFNRHPQDVIDLLVPKGYLVYAIQENGLKAIHIIDDSTVENNFLFIHEDNRKHFDIIDRFVRV
jgi:FkbM family methyltransferase